MHVQDVHDPTVETNVIHVAIEVVNKVACEVVQPDSPVPGEVVQPDVPIADEVSTTNSVHIVTADIEVTTPSTGPSMHTDGAFQGGPIDRSLLTEYADHVAYRLWQEDVYILCLTLI